MMPESHKDRTAMNCNDMSCDNCDLCDFMEEYSGESTRNSHIFVDRYDIRSDDDDQYCYTIYRFMKKVNKLKILEKLT